MFAAIPVEPPQRKTPKEMVEEICSRSYESLTHVHDHLAIANLNLLDHKQHEKAVRLMEGLEDLLEAVK